MVLIFYLAPAEYFCIILEKFVDIMKYVLYTGTQQGSGDNSRLDRLIAPVEMTTTLRVSNPASHAIISKSQTA